MAKRKAPRSPERAPNITIRAPTEASLEIQPTTPQVEPSPSSLGNRLSRYSLSAFSGDQSFNSNRGSHHESSASEEYDPARSYSPPPASSSKSNRLSIEFTPSSNSSGSVNHHNAYPKNHQHQHRESGSPYRENDEEFDRSNEDSNRHSWRSHRNILGSIHHSASPNSSIKNRSPRLESKSFLNEAAAEHDFDALKEGLSFALGGSDHEGKWFPKGSEEKQAEENDKPSQLKATDRKSQDLTSTLTPDSHYNNHQYRENIPLQIIDPTRRPSYFARSNSNFSTRTPTKTPTKTHANPFNPERRPSLAVPTLSHTSGTGSFHSDRGSADHLETGDGEHLALPSRVDGKSSPTRISNVITRISERIAGTGSNPAASAQKDPSSSPYKGEASSGAGNNLSVSDINSSLRATPAATPISGRFPLFRDDGVGDVHSAYQGSQSTERRYSDYLHPTPRTAHKVTFNDDITEEFNTDAVNEFVADGLGVYLNEVEHTSKTQESTIIEDEDNLNNSTQHEGLIHQLNPQQGANTPLLSGNKKNDFAYGYAYGKRVSSNREYTNIESMYLFGNSLKLFSPQSKFRQWCHKLLTNYLTNIFLLVMLILQTGLLSHRQWNPIKMGGYVYAGYNWADYVLIAINCIYTIEIVAKVVAYGFVDDHVMFKELGLPYPENEIKSMYFSSVYIKKILKWTGIPRLLRGKTQQYKEAQEHENPLRGSTVNMDTSYNKARLSSDEEVGNSSDDPDIKEIDIGDHRTNTSISHMERSNLSQKYKDLMSHHQPIATDAEISAQDRNLNGNFTNTTTNNLDGDTSTDSILAGYESDNSDEEDIGLTDEPVYPTQDIVTTNTLLLNKTNKTMDSLSLKRAYIRNSWHRIDFLSMIAFWISLFLSIGHYDAQQHLMIFRAISCLRILRLCNLTTGTTTILTACKIAIPQLIDVSIFISCFWLFFGILGVQSFKSSLTRQCVWTNPNDANETFVNEHQFCGSYIGLDGTPQPYIQRNGVNSEEIKGFRCPKYSQCISGDNPYGGTVNFDNILQSLEMVFVVMSANTFTDIMYYTMDSDNMAACLFFISAIFILTVWLINVFIAVIVASFNITSREVAEEKRKLQEKKRSFSLFGSSNDISIHTERINLLKKQNIFLKYYYNFEFIFPILVVIDLFVHCFRSFDMTDARRHTLYRFEVGFTAVFMAEVLLRFIFHFPNWRLFFASRRNSFDLLLGVITTIIIISPIKEKLGHAYYWLTVFQLMRFYRVVLATPITRNLWLKIMGNFKAIFDLALFYFILLFLVSVILARFFEGGVPVDEIDNVDYPMHTLADAFIALYIITSTENWTDVLYGVQEHAANTSSRAFGAIFLIAWFILSNMIIMNIFIAVIAKTLEVSEDGKRKKQLLQFIDNMTDRLHNLQPEAGILTRIKSRVFKTRGVREDLQSAVVNLLLSGTAVNDFLDPEDLDYSEDEDDGEDVRTLPTKKWKRWLHVNFRRSYFRNPFYVKSNKRRKISIENFDPARFAQNIIVERNALITKQNRFLKENPRFNYVFYLMGPRHRLRRFCQRIVKPSYGQRIDGVEPYGPVAEAFVVLMFLATIALVITACYLTPLYRRRMVALYGNYNWTFWLEVAFNIHFTAEFIIKIIADGLIFTPNGYMRSSWNLIDMIVLLSLWIEFFAFIRDDGNLSRIVRGLKALRALRLLTISETAKANFHNTLISGFWKIINAAIISLCLLFPFSIWGLDIFAGRLGYCIDGSSPVSACFNEFDNHVFNWDIVSPNVYTNPQLHFNSFATSFSSLFEIVSLEGWTDLLQNVMASTGVGTPPEKNASPFNGFFVVLFNFVSIVFILTLFVSVIISNYSKTTGRAYMTKDQIAWYQVKNILIQVKPSKRKDFEKLSLFRKFCYRMTVEKNKIWNRILNFVLFLHVVSLLLECWPSYISLNTFRTVIYMSTATFFTINILMKLVAQGPSMFIRYKWNIFNFVVSIGAFVTTAVGIRIDQDSAFINVNKLFLVGILAFVIPRSNRLSQLLRFASASLPTLLSLLFTWLVVFLVFAIAMNQIFGLTKIGPNGNGNLNLRSVPKALILLFRSSFGEGWNYVMEDYTLSSPFCTTGTSLDDSDCGNKQYSYILFMAWNIFSMYIFLNMFVSLILDSFSYINHRSNYSNLLKRQEVRKFKRTWQKFDPQGTGYIKPYDLPKLLHTLDGALSFHFYSGSLEIPTLCKQWFTRNDPHNPYDITVNYGAIDAVLNEMDIPKIRERRKAYERFMEEALLNMELNNDPGISFTRILLQLPLYTSFEAGQCLNLIDFLERRLLVQKVEKRLNTKRVYETIAAYACRWKYRQDQRRGIRDTNIAFDKELKRHSYFTNESRSIRSRSIYSKDFEDALYNQRENVNTAPEFLDYGSRNPPDSVHEDKSDNKDEGLTSGIYIPKSPLNVFTARNRGSTQLENQETKEGSSNEKKKQQPKLYVEIPSTSKLTPDPSPNFGSPGGHIQISPFMAPPDRDALYDERNISVMELSDIGEALESSSWSTALDQVRNEEGHWTEIKKFD